MKCECCGENDARYRVHLTDMEGGVIATRALCAECVIGANITGRGAALDIEP